MGLPALGRIVENFQHQVEHPPNSCAGGAIFGEIGQLWDQLHHGHKQHHQKGEHHEKHEHEGHHHKKHHGHDEPHNGEEHHHHGHKKHHGHKEHHSAAGEQEVDHKGNGHESVFNDIKSAFGDTKQALGDLQHGDFKKAIIDGKHAFNDIMKLAKDENVVADFTKVIGDLQHGDFQGAVRDGGNAFADLGRLGQDLGKTLPGLLGHGERSLAHQGQEIQNVLNNPEAWEKLYNRA